MAVKNTAKKSSKSECGACSCWQCNVGTRGGCVYFLGFLGAAVYYVQLADGFWMGTWGVIKALVWPALLVYHLLGL